MLLAKSMLDSQAVKEQAGACCGPWAPVCEPSWSVGGVRGPREKQCPAGSLTPHLSDRRLPDPLIEAFPQQPFCSYNLQILHKHLLGQELCQGW